MIEEINDGLLKRISELEKEVITLKLENANSSNDAQTKLLRYELFQMHERMTKLSHENKVVRGERDYYKQCFEVVTNSKTWRSTQFIRDIFWRLKSK